MSDGRGGGLRGAGVLVRLDVPFTAARDWWVTEFADGHHTGAILVTDGLVNSTGRVCLGHAPANCGQLFMHAATNRLASVDITVWGDEVVAASVPEPGFVWLFVLALVGAPFWRHRALNVARRSRLIRQTMMLLATAVMLAIVLVAPASAMAQQMTASGVEFLRACALVPDGLSNEQSGRGT